MVALRKSYVTISIDDGHPDDLKAAELLRKYAMPATFYVPANNPERPLMSPSEIKSISDDAQLFEMGGHTLNHQPLHKLSYDAAYEEVSKGKEWLEDVTSKPVNSFCYPKGKMSKAAIKATRDSGFTGARTCMFNLLDKPSDPMLWGVSTHAKTQNLKMEYRHALTERNFKGIFNFSKIFQREVDWYDHFIHGLDYVNENGGIAHLYFHSWEITATDQWVRLEQMIRTIKSMENIQAKTNGDIFETH